MQQHLIVYAKRPLPGYAKTRLGAAIGTSQAAGVYARLLYTYLVALTHIRWPHTTIELSVADSDDVDYFRKAFPELLVRAQSPGNIGMRMAASFAQAFDEGAEAVVLTGSDVPGLTADIVRHAFELLSGPSDDDWIPGAIGPASDGGYYLIGMRRPGADVFGEIEWSTSRVLEQTEARAASQRLRLRAVMQLSDIDSAAEYIAWSSNRLSNYTSGES